MINRQITQKKGFTLVELMVVLAIIGLLAIIGIPIILNAQKASRDATRLKQLESVQASAASIFTKTNSAVTISNGQTVTLTSNGSSGSTYTDKITLANNYSLNLITTGGCVKSDATTINALYDQTNRKLTYCNEDGNTAEVLNF